jgi:ribosomal protein S6--L-glutamate ligase
MLGFRRIVPPPNPVISEMLRILECRGFQLELGIAEDLVLQPDALEVTHDLYILKSHADFWLSIAGVLHKLGAFIINSYPASLGVQNKVAIADQLTRAGVPTPRTWLTGDLGKLRQQVVLHPLIIKPNRGEKGREVVLVSNAADLERLQPPTALVLAQEYVQGDGVLKVYVIDQDVFAVRRPGPLGRGGSPERYVVGTDVRRIALRCGRIFDLRVYGVDVVEGPCGPVVVDVNYFPSFLGVAEAPARLADAIETAAYGCGGTAAWRNTWIPAVRSI